MSARAIVSGALHKAAELRTSKNGNQFATFTIRESLKGATRWWLAVAFSESTIEALKELAVGDPIAVAGDIDAEIYAPAGSESRISWRITADAVLSARAKPKKSKPQDGRQPFETNRWEGGPNDDVSF
jgi:Single-strand binding protein family